MRVLMLGSSLINMNRYRYTLCRSLLLGDDIEIETTAEGASRMFVDERGPELLILEGDKSEPAVSRFLEWLGTLPASRLNHIQVLVMKKNPENADESYYHSFPFKCKLITKPLNVREVREVILPFINN